MTLPLPAACALLLACTLAAAQAGAADFRWPGGQRAAVSLAYDDALDSQLDVPPILWVVDARSQGRRTAGAGCLRRLEAGTAPIRCPAWPRIGATLICTILMHLLIVSGAFLAVWRRSLGAPAHHGIQVHVNSPWGRVAASGSSM